MIQKMKFLLILMMFSFVSCNTGNFQSEKEWCARQRIKRGCKFLEQDSVAIPALRTTGIVVGFTGDGCYDCIMMVRHHYNGVATYDEFYPKEIYHIKEY